MYICTIRIFCIMKQLLVISCLVTTGAVAKAESKDMSVLRWLTADDSSAIVEPLIDTVKNPTNLKSNRFIEPITSCKIINGKDFAAQIQHCKSQRQGWLKI